MLAVKAERHSSTYFSNKITYRKTTSDYDREKLQERLAKLAGGVAVIYVGAASEVEMKERKTVLTMHAHVLLSKKEYCRVVAWGYIRAIKTLDSLKAENDDENLNEIIRRD